MLSTAMAGGAGIVASVCFCLVEALFVLVVVESCSFEMVSETEGVIVTFMLLTGGCVALEAEGEGSAAVVLWVTTG